MTDSAISRREQRIAIRKKRADLDDDDQAAASMAVMARLARIPLLRNPGTIAGYRATRGEVDIDASLVLLHEAGALVTVPKVLGEYLEFVTWTPQTSSTTGQFGISEPIEGDPVPLLRHDVVLAPLVAFDRQGHRLGQGGGFYDRALQNCGDKRPVVIGIAHSIQEVDAVSVEPWDVDIDAVVTEDETIEFRRGILDPGI